MNVQFLGLLLVLFSDFHLSRPFNICNQTFLFYLPPLLFLWLQKLCPPSLIISGNKLAFHSVELIVIHCA